jgi:Reverse transcriptase (RNA-dependent DNA polymerase)
MPIKDDLLRRGYLPENLPPTFTTDSLGIYLAQKRTWYSQSRDAVRAATYNASKRGMTRRIFSLVHPETAHDLAEFISNREIELTLFFQRSQFSLSVPRVTLDGERAVEIATHSELESTRLARLAPYRFVARTDISRFYHSIYTHSIPWAFHGKAASKADRRANSANLFMNRLDLILRAGQDGQTIGIPVGPDASRYIAEVICTAIDQEFVARGGAAGCAVLRHVDDVWIGANSHAEAEAALYKYREAIRAFELDINETKTHIYSESFRFSDSWPTDVASRIEFALASPSRRISERLRAALEHAFALTAEGSDDGILKYTLRYLDKSNLASAQWEVVEPFLKRAAVHYGHTIDFVARIIVWRHLAKRDLDIEAWGNILVALIDRHGRLGNDGEVCWALYAAIRLGVEIPLSAALEISRNCGAISIVALLSAAQIGLVDQAIFGDTENLIMAEDASGPYWPLFLEWRVRDWPEGTFLVPRNALIEELIGQNISIFDATQLPSVFRDLAEDDFGEVEHAIEQRSSYDDEGDDDEEEEADEMEVDF